MQRSRLVPVCFLWTLGFAVIEAGVCRADDADAAPTLAQLLDPIWIETSLADLGIDVLIKQYDDVDDPLVQRVQDALILSRWFLLDHPEELRSQLQARLISSTELELQVFQDLPADRVRARAMRASLNQAGDALVNAYQVGILGGDFIASPDGLLIAKRWIHRDANLPGQLYGIQLRNGLSGDIIASFAESEELKLPIAISPSSRLIIGADESGDVFAWDKARGEIAWTIPMPPMDLEVYLDSVYRVAFSPDERKVAIAMPGMGGIYDSASGDVIATLDIQPDAEVEDIAFLDEERLAVCVANTGLRIWDVATGAISLQHDFVSSRLTSDGRLTLVLDAVEEEYVYLYLYSFEVRDTLSGELIRKVTFDERIPLRSWDFDPEGAHVIINSFRYDLRYNAPILAYSIETGELVSDIRQAASVGFNMRAITGMRVLMSGFGPQMYLWDLNRTGERRIAEQSGEIYHIDMTADGSLALVAEANGGQVQLWDLTAGNVTVLLEAPAADEPRYFHDVSISDDGRLMLATSFDQILKLNPILRGVDVLLQSPLGEGEGILDMQVSGDGSTVIIAGEDSACVVSLADARRVYSTEGDYHADISTDARMALVGERLINLDTGLEQTIDEMTNSITELSDDGNRVMDFYLLRGSTIWNSATLERLAADPIGWKHNSELLSPCCDLSADGRYTVSTNLRGQVIVYDVHEAKVLAVLAIDDIAFSDIVISGDGSTVLIATRTGRLHHFRLENLPP